MIQVGIVGATGYGGVELIRLILGHPNATLAKISSVSFEGKRISEVYPSLIGACDDVLVSQEEVIKASDVVFAALPHGLSQPLAKACMDAGKVFIDFGADFRLESEAEYETWYGAPFDYPELHKIAVYGLCELARENIKGARLIANPGCYPTSIQLGLAPALKNGLCSTKGIVIDSKSGATGAGRSLSQTTHFCDLDEGFAPYKVAAHRHTPEIEQGLSKMAGEKVTVTFVPHLLPLKRGIISTMYTESNVSLETAYEAYCKFYENEPFVTVLPLGMAANLKNVCMTNQCHISLHRDEHAGRLIVVSAIDNMVKGAAGQAVQNMNIVFGLDETTGLDLVAPAF